ncbi:SMP-30/Gluconolaconase/LRE-like region family protein [Leishmania donovani]|uniref:SMP-30/Gluconolaconase/LRE-like region family protein n=1 Tax=Leishmania donovani TaxID=5661 RepID=A0A504WYS9_LEIDO|nr:SMP-30/Gluconolaconase/LRE-like region family protein [Leishmania donovani]
MAALFQVTARRVSTPAGIAPCQLGESPTWDEAHQALWWVDILGEALYVGQPAPGSMCDFDRVAVLPLPGHRPGFIVHTAPGDASGTGKPGAHSAAPYHAVWGSQKGLYYTSYSTTLPWRISGQTCRPPKLRALTPVSHYQIARFPQSLFQLQGGRVYRFNDGKVGPDNSLWCGGIMERTDSFPRRDLGCGSLMRWVAESPAKALSSSSPSVTSNGFSVEVPNVTVSNGIGWSPAGDVLYHVDTPAAVIRAYPYQAVPPADGPERGHHHEGRTRDAGYDRNVGATVAERIAITGVVKLPEVALCTSCCFGDADLTTLYITTARGTSKEAAASCKQEGAGWIYAANMKGIAKGMPASRLRLPESSLSSLQQHHL